MTKRFGRPLRLSLALTVLWTPASLRADSFSIRSDAPTSLVTRKLHSEKEIITHPVAAGDALTFGVAIPRDVYISEKGSYTVSVQAETPRGSTVIFKDNLVPATKPEHRGWLEKKIPLDKFVGQTVTFRFSSAASRGKQSALTEALWGGIRLGNFRRKKGEFNIILISIDTLRWDRLGVAGYRRDTSPAIDALANNGVYFRKAVAQSSWTKPSHMSLFTSLYPSNHGLEADWGQSGFRRRLPERIPVMTEILASNGFLTRAFTGSAHVTSVVGFDRGFDSFQEFPLKNHADGVHVFDNGLRWIRDNRDQKFFLFLHTYEVHGPRRHVRYVRKGMSRRARMNAAYDSGVRYVSDLIEGLMTSLGGLKLLDDTMIIIFSDHGESLGNHGLKDHASSLYDEQILVPLIFYKPGLLKPRRMDEYNAQLVDVFPTICDLAGISAPAGLVGRSLKSILMGEDLPKASIGVSELRWNAPGGERLDLGDGGRLAAEDKEPPVQKTKRMVSLRYLGDDGYHKVIHSPGFDEGFDDGKFLSRGGSAWKTLHAANGRQLFDLSADPAEKLNMAEKAPGLFERYRYRILEELSRAPKPTAQERAEEEAEAGKPEAELDAAIAEQLRSLGY